MRKVFTSLSFASMLMVTSVANAQFTQTVEQYPTNDYSAVTAQFKFSEVAAQLNSDTTTVRKALDEWMNDETGEVTASMCTMYIQCGDTVSQTWTADGKGSSWMNKNGHVVAYGDEAYMYSGYSYSSEDDVFEISLGQFPDRCLAGESFVYSCFLQYGDKKATFTVTMDIKAVPEMASPTQSFAALNIVKEYQGTLTFKEGKSYENSTFTLEAADLAEALGIEESVLSANIAKVTVTRQCMTTDDVTYAFTDSVKALGDYGTDGWFGRYSTTDDVTGNTTVLSQNAPLSWGANCTSYIHDLKLEEGKFSLSYGQYPGTMKAGDSDFIELYIVNDVKAAQITLGLTVEPQDVYDFSEMQMVGDTTINVTASVDDNYATKPFVVNMATVAEKLGCEISDLDQVYAFSAENEVSDNHTESSGGFYFNEDGFIGEWGASATYFVSVGSLENGKFNIGQRSGKFTDIKEDVVNTTHLLFMNGSKYFYITLNYTVTAAQGMAPTELKGTDYLAAEIVPSTTDWAYGKKTGIDLEYIAGIIGTTEFDLYTDKVEVDEETQQNVFSFSNKYTCTPAPGFWFGTTTYENSENQVIVDNAGWGTNSFGLTLDADSITWYQYPGQRSVGDAYVANLYFVNPSNGDYFKYVVSVSYVEQASEDVEVAGKYEQLFILDRDAEEYSMTVTEEQVNAILAAVGASDIEAFKQDGAIYAAKSASSFKKIGFDEGVFFNADGYVVSEEDQTAVSQLALSIDGSTVNIYADMADESNDIPVGAKAILAFEYGSKRFVVTINFTDATPVVSVSSADVTVKDIYTVAGVKVNEMQKGINIVKMSDGTTKKILK